MHSHLSSNRRFIFFECWNGKEILSFQAYDDSTKIIASKDPSDSKVELFWKLFYNFNITAIVMITENDVGISV